MPLSKVAPAVDCTAAGSPPTGAIRLYPGREIRVPIDIEVNQGECDIDQVLSDVLGVTKLNYKMDAGARRHR